MGCFPACFTSSTRRKHKKPVSLETTEEAVRFEPTKIEDIVKTSNPSLNPKSQETEEQLDNAEKKEEILKEIEPIGATTVVLTSRPLSHRYENCSNSEEEDESLIGLSGSDLNGDECFDVEVESNKEVVVQEHESSESLFSISIGSRKQAESADDDEVDEKEVNSPKPKPKPNETDKIGIDDTTVLIPIENLTQWKEAKAKADHLASKKNEEKESMNVGPDLCFPISPEPTLKLSKQFTRAPLKSSDLNPVDQEAGVDTSLSSWLVGSETTPKSNGSNNSVGSLVKEKQNLSRSLGDRPVLGAWTSVELKQLSTNSSTLNRLPSVNLDQMPIIGTVGSYCSHTGQAVDSDSNSSCGEKENRAGRNRENEKAILKTIPLEARLEKASVDMAILGA